MLNCYIQLPITTYRALCFKALFINMIEGEKGIPDKADVKGKVMDYNKSEKKLGNDESRKTPPLRS